MTTADGPGAYQVTRSYHGKSADTRSSERRQQLLETGIRLIGTVGYASVSLNAICSEAGLTKRYFYESFESVDALLIEAFQKISAELQDQVIQRIADQTTPKTMITAGFRAFFEYIFDHPERGKIFLVEALNITTLQAGLLGSGGGQVSPFLLATTLTFLEAEVLPKPVLEVMSQGAVGAALFVGQNWIASNYQQPVDELVTGVSEICFGIGQRLNIPLDSTRP